MERIPLPKPNSLPLIQFNSSLIQYRTRQPVINCPELSFKLTRSGTSISLHPHTDNNHQTKTSNLSMLKKVRWSDSFVSFRTNRPINQSTNMPANQSTNQLTKQPAKLGFRIFLASVSYQLLDQNNSKDILPHSGPRLYLWHWRAPSCLSPICCGVSNRGYKSNPQVNIITPLICLSKYKISWEQWSHVTESEPFVIMFLPPSSDRCCDTTNSHQEVQRDRQILEIEEETEKNKKKDYCSPMGR